MKKILYLFTLVLFGFAPKIKDPAHWVFSIKNESGKLEIHFKAIVDKPWHIYSQIQPQESISTPTKIIFIKNPLIKMNGVLSEIGDKKTFTDQTIGVAQFFYADSVDFVQNLEVKGAVHTKLVGNITYQVCTDEMCLPAKTIPFSVDVP